MLWVRYVNSGFDEPTAQHLTQYQRYIATYRDDTGLDMFSDIACHLSWIERCSLAALWLLPMRWRQVCPVS
jgi:hypothetical protein